MAADVVKIVNGGLAIITNLMKGAGTEPKYVAWGTGTTPAAVANTDMETERGETRATGTSSRVQTTVANDTYQVVGTLTAAGTAAAITEAGLFDAESEGNMFLHATFDVINLQIGDSCEFTIKTVLADGSA